MNRKIQRLQSRFMGNDEGSYIYALINLRVLEIKFHGVCAKILLFSLLLFPFTLQVIQAQGIEGWPQEIISKANTARDNKSLSPEEKQLILLSNLARIDGERFTETILLPYLDGEKSSRYTKSLIRDLKKIENLDLLYPENDLIKVAREHSENSGKRGTTGHQGFNKRYGPLLGKYNEVAENCAYGYDRAKDILIRLLIDEDIPEMGHRKNLLNPNFNAIGISIMPHKKYRHNCVMSFGKKVK